MVLLLRVGEFCRATGELKSRDGGRQPYDPVEG